MSKLTEFSKQIDKIININENLITLVIEAQAKFTNICDALDTNAAKTNETNVHETSSLLHYFSLSKHFSNSDGFSINDILSGVLSHPMFMFVLLYLIIFFIIFLATLMLYSKCTRRFLSCLTCGLCFSRNKISHTVEDKKSEQNRENSKDSNKKSNVSIENEEYSISKEEKETTEEKETSLKSGSLNHTVEPVCKTQNGSKEEKELEEDAHLSDKSDKKKRIKMFLIFNCGLLLTITMLIMYICLSANVVKNKTNTIRSFCEIVKSAGDILIGTCAPYEGDENPCFTLKETLVDGVSVLRAYEQVMKKFEEQNMLTEERDLPILEDMENFAQKLRLLSQNVDNNYTRVLNDYQHQLLLKEHIGTLIDKTLEKIDNERRSNTKLIYGARKTLIKMADDMNHILKNDTGRLLTSLNESLKNLKKFVSNSHLNIMIEANVNMAFNSFHNGFIIELIILIFITVAWCVILYLHLKQEEKKVSTIIIKLAALFSIYFGVISIIQMVFTLFLIIFSMTGSTTCVMMHENFKLNKNLQKTISGIPIIETCLKDATLPLVDFTQINSLTKSVNAFDVTEITKQTDNFFYIQQNTLKLFEQSFNNVRNNMWISKIENTKAEGLFQKLKNEQVKAALLITHIFKKNLTGSSALYGVDDFLNIANPILLQPGYALCFENVECDGDTNKYNITRSSTTEDSKYKIIKQHVNNQANGNNAEDLDIVLQILVLKTKLSQDKIFSIQELDPSHTEKLNIREYIVPDDKIGEGQFYISVYIRKLIEEMKNPIHMIKFKQIIFQLIDVKEFSVSTIQKVKKKLTCQVAMVPLRRVKNHFCSNVVYGVAHMTVLCLVVGILAFLLWLYHLCLWLYFKVNREREEAITE